MKYAVKAISSWPQAHRNVYHRYIYEQCGTCSTKIYFLCDLLDSASRSQQVLVTHIVTHILPVSLFGNSMT